MGGPDLLICRAHIFQDGPGLGDKGRVLKGNEEEDVSIIWNKLTVCGGSWFEPM